MPTPEVFDAIAEKIYPYRKVLTWGALAMWAGFILLGLLIHTLFGPDNFPRVLFSALWPIVFAICCIAGTLGSISKHFGRNAAPVEADDSRRSRYLNLGKRYYGALVYSASFVVAFVPLWWVTRDKFDLHLRLGPEVLPTVYRISPKEIRGPDKWKSFVMTVQDVVMEDGRRVFNLKQLEEFWTENYPRYGRWELYAAYNQLTNHMLFTTSMAIEPPRLFGVAVCSTGQNPSLLSLAIVRKEDWPQIKQTSEVKPSMGEWTQSEIEKLLGGEYGSDQRRGYPAFGDYILYVVIRADCDRELARKILTLSMMLME